MYIIDNLSYSDLKVRHRLESKDATIDFALVALVNVGAEDLFLKWRAAICAGSPGCLIHDGEPPMRRA